MGLNLVLLLFVSFLPFTTSLLANHLDDSAAHIAVMIFGINLTLASLMVNVMFGYAAPHAGAGGRRRGRRGAAVLRPRDAGSP